MENAGRRRRGGLKRNPKVVVPSQAAQSNKDPNEMKSVGDFDSNKR